MRTFAGLCLVLILWESSAFATDDLCNFSKPADATITLFQAFAKASKTYNKAKDVDFVLIGCANPETRERDTTYGLLKKHGLPKDRDGVTVLFILFEGYEDGEYQFGLHTSDDPWMDGYARVDATTGAIEPTYPF